VGRFDANQKGIDLIYQILKEKYSDRFQFVILGRGNPEWEEKFKLISKNNPQNIYARLAFDDSLAHQIYAASDFMLIPSRYEPCGLVQMLAMAFGTIPIAHKTGGLADSISDEVNGFLFDSYSSKALWNKIGKAVDIWRNHPERFAKMVQAALATDFSWEKSTSEYLEIYKKLANDTFT
jgi:starch synthase